MRAAPIFALTALAPLWASPGTYRSFASLDSIPVLAAGTVEQVIRLGEVPASQRRFPWAERNFEARVLIHRVFFQGRSQPFAPGDPIAIHYANPEGPLPSGGGGYGPPVILDIHKGQTFLFPLLRKNGSWALDQDQSRNPVLPALAAEPLFAGPPHTGSGFVFREIAHVLARGGARQRSQAAVWLTWFSGDVPPALPRLIRNAFGVDDNVWLEAGCAFLGILGVPRNNAELVYGEASPPFHSVRQLITWILWKGDRRDYPNRLIRCLLRNSGAYAWGAAVTLVDFKDSTVLIDGLNAAMRRNKPGSMTVAHFILNAGQRAVLPEALELAQRLVTTTSGRGAELQAAAQLILKEGDSRQFEALAATLVRLKQEDENRYRELWGAAAYGQNRRELRLAAILIDDRRFGFGALRYCDVAAGEVQRISGVPLGIAQQMTPAARDAAVAGAAAWLKAHPDAALR
jgi:hypothetical protein